MLIMINCLDLGAPGGRDGVPDGPGDRDDFPGVPDDRDDAIGVHVLLGGHDGLF